MKHENWPYEHGPPPEELPERDNGWPGSWLMLAFFILAPLIYFGPELGSIESWIATGYETIENWVAPIRDFVFG